MERSTHPTVLPGVLQWLPDQPEWMEPFFTLSASPEGREEILPMYKIPALVAHRKVKWRRRDSNS
jgi:hypothetical protein